MQMTEYWRGCIIKYTCRAGHKHHSGKSIQQSKYDLDKQLNTAPLEKDKYTEYNN